MTADGGLITGAGKAHDSGLIFGPFSVVFYFSFHFCFDLPQVSNCYESDSFIFDFWNIFCCFLFLFSFLL